MFLALIITLALSYGLARTMIQHNVKEIIENWDKYRCKAEVMISANVFKPDTDPRSGYEYAYDNFNFCTSELAKYTLSMALKPVMDIFYQMMNAAIQSIGFTMNLRTLASNLYNGLTRIFDVFSRRFNLTIHELHRTFLLQMSAMAKANAIANASVYAGISVIKTVMNMFQLMIIVTISILVILVVMVIFLFFILAPVIPVILIAVAVITATAAAASVGGMADSFCFTGETEIMMYDGPRKISELIVGDRLYDGSQVSATIKFAANAATELYIVDGVTVAGSHILYKGGRPILVKDLPGAVPISNAASVLYCLNTTNHKIPVKGRSGIMIFADWEELDGAEMADWDHLVRSLLKTEAGSSAAWVMESESGITEETLLETATGMRSIERIAVGDKIRDGAGMTTVVGTVILDGRETNGLGAIGPVVCSAACWIRNAEGQWIRAASSPEWRPVSPVKRMRMLITESGTFTVGGIMMRDFTDVGVDQIEKTYDFTLNHINQRVKINAAGY
jgi:hypothetical protein